jgi:hypothetical protein
VLARPAGWHAACVRADRMPDPARGEIPLHGSRRDAAIDVVVLAKVFRRMQQRLQRLASRLSDACDVVDAAAKAMEELAQELPGVSEVSRQRGGVRSPEEQRVMRAEADAGASSLQVMRHADGTGEVSVNGRRPFALPPKLATLLAVLVVPGDEADDDLLGWHTKSMVAAALNKKTGGALSPGAVPKLVYKLRRAFRDAGENWLLIQTNRERGVRLAVRR